ncbi:MAG: V-type ATP synthase subunit I, partial [Treponema sp.]|nr:V-type ATP synthase subunit I [Treponema sp.]
PGMPSFHFAEKSLVQIDTELAELRDKLKALEDRIKGFADRRPVLEKEMAGIERDIYFESSLAEFEKAGDVAPEYGFSWLKGYIPAEDLEELKEAAKENSWAIVADDPEPDDEVPTKLRNIPPVRLLSPLTEFLDLLPGYREVDISPWFLLFFTIYFGMIFGDAAYGMLLLIAAVIGMVKTAKKGIPLGLWTLLLLSVSNVIWGTLTCTWFGIEADKLPAFFRNISLSYFCTAKGTSQLMVNQNLQVFCFTLALLQLSIGRIGGIIRGLRKRDLKLFADLGVLAMLCGMYNVVLFLVASNAERHFPLLPVSFYLLGGGFILNFIFGYYAGSISGAILESLKNIITVILGITGVFSDIMSYIRLWAVGLAGASLAATVNTMVGPMLGNFLIFLGIVILAFGHGLNLVLSTLSVLVHGVRLNILEFSGHVGLTWSGIAYKPFAETAKK